MSLVYPFKGTSFTIYGADEKRTRELALALTVLDEFTEEPVRTRVRVALQRKTPAGRLAEETPVVNHSGAFCFEGQPAGDYVLIAEPDPVLEYYFLHPEQPNDPWLDGFERDVAIPRPGGPGMVVVLSPKPGYPYPPGATLARGRVVDNAGVGVNRAVVSATYPQSRPTLGDPQASVIATAETRTDRRGYFTLFFRSLHVTPSNVQVTAREGGRQAVETATLREREAVKVPLLKFP